MMERMEVNGQPAIVSYLMKDFSPAVSASSAEIVKVMFDNGDSLIGAAHVGRLVNAEIDMDAAIEELSSNGIGVMRRESGTEEEIGDQDLDAAVSELIADAESEKFKAVGTKRTHYTPAKNGPYDCAHCMHSAEKGTRCNHPEQLLDAKDDGTLDDKGLAIVEPGGCCEYERKE